MYCSPFCNEQGEIPTTEQHLDVTGSSTSPVCNNQCLLFTIKDFMFSIVTDMQCLYGSNNILVEVKRVFRQVSGQIRRGREQTETDSGAKIPIGFFALSLTMMLLHVRAEECC